MAMHQFRGTDPPADLLKRGIAPVLPAHWAPDRPLLRDGAVTTGGAPAGPPPSRNACRRAFNAAQAAQPCRAFFGLLPKKKGGGEGAGAGSPAGAGAGPPADAAPIATTSTCPHGDTCRFSHDPASLEAAASARAPGLPGHCPLQGCGGGAGDSGGGACPYGPECRWAASHGAGAAAAGDDGGAPPTAASLGETAPTLPPAIALPPLSSLGPWPPPPRTAGGGAPVLTWDVSRALAGGVYDFAGADAVCRALGVEVRGGRAAGKRARAMDEAGQHQAPGRDAPAAPAAAGGPPPTTASTPATPPYHETPAHPREARPLDFRGKRYLAPLTTVGNLPFRALAVSLGAEVTCGEMALATQLLAGRPGEWALTKRHPSEACFGVQIAAGYGDAGARAAAAVVAHCPGGPPDFLDINAGCPIDLVCDKQAGAALLRKPARLESVVRAVVGCAAGVPVTLKVRKGYDDGKDSVHEWIPTRAVSWGLAAVTIHGRSREQRYTRAADWGYVGRVAEEVWMGREGGGGGSGGDQPPPPPRPSPLLQVIGGGDVYTFHDHERHLAAYPHLATTMVARGGLIKPWLFTEMAERREWDISAPERLDLVSRFCSLGLAHWGSDGRGVETTRRFLLEWLSYAHRYVPLGLLSERLPPELTGAERMGLRCPPLAGRSELETVLASPDPGDWVRISELVLGPAPASLRFVPKHKSKSLYVVPGKRDGSEGGGGGEDDEENG